MPGMGNTKIIVDSLSNTAVLARGGACYLMAAKAISVQNGVTFVQIWDRATAAEVTVGTTLPTWVISVPTNTTTGDTSVGDGVPSAQGLHIMNGIVMAATTTPCGSTAPASACHVRLAIW